jgi:hypothetical protein
MHIERSLYPRILDAADKLLAQNAEEYQGKSYTPEEGAVIDAMIDCGIKDSDLSKNLLLRDLVIEGLKIRHAKKSSEYHTKDN